MPSHSAIQIASKKQYKPTAWKTRSNDSLSTWIRRCFETLNPRPTPRFILRGSGPLQSRLRFCGLLFHYIYMSADVSESEGYKTQYECSEQTNLSRRCCVTPPRSKRRGCFCAGHISHVYLGDELAGAGACTLAGFFTWIDGNIGLGSKT